MSTNWDDLGLPDFQDVRALKFTYSLLLQVIFGVGGVGFLAFALLSSVFVPRKDLDVWTPLLFLCFGISGVLLWYLFSARIYLDAEAISLQRLGRVVRTKRS